MFGKEYGQPQREKLPTLKQYVSSLPKTSKALQQTFQVEIVWLPGKFDNFTLQTHAFRLVITPKHPLYEQLAIAFDDLEEFGANRSIGLDIKDRTTLSFEVAEMPTKRGVWKQIGQSGFRFESD